MTVMPISARRALILPMIVLWSLLASPAAAQTGDVAGVHDPVIARAGDAYYVFSTGGGIPIRRSTDLITWQRVGRVFEQLPAWATADIPGARGAWAPDISFFAGQYHLYYAVSTFGSRRSCIGLATNATLDPADPHYRWVDRGKVIETQPSDDWNAIDPNVVVDRDGAAWMTLGSFWSGIKLRRLDAKTGMLSKDDAKLYSLARRPSPGAIEAPFLVRRGETYYLFVSYDRCCRGVESTYNIRVGRSTAGITGPYLDRDNKPMLEGGGTLVLESAGTIRGPGHQAILHDTDGAGVGRDWLVHHFYDATDRGRAKLQIRPLTWDAAGWPVAGEPVAKPRATSAPTTTTRGATTLPMR
jgi:arabinan endo-1,5-alpha-L-arabinosidase